MRCRWALVSLTLLLASACGGSDRGDLSSGAADSAAGSVATASSLAAATSTGSAGSVSCDGAARLLEAEFLLSVFVQSNYETRERYEVSWFKALDALAPTLPPDAASDARALAALDSAIADWSSDNSAALDRIMATIAPACFPSFRFVNCRTAPAADCGAWHREVSELDASELPWASDRRGGSTTTR